MKLSKKHIPQNTADIKRLWLLVKEFLGRAPHVEGVESASLRQDNIRVIRNRLMVFVLLPTLIAFSYKALLSQSWHVAEAKFVVQVPSQKNDQLYGILGETIGTSTKDVLLLKDYILSRDALYQLNKNNQYLDVFAGPEVRWVNRVRKSAPFESLYAYYLDRLNVAVDSASGVATLSIQAPTAEHAVQLASSMLANAEQVLNALAERFQQDQLHYAESQLKAAEENLIKARQEHIAYQYKYGEMDPAAAAKSGYQIKGDLESSIAKVRAEIDEKKAYLKEGSYPLLALENKLKSLIGQVKREKGLMTDEKTGVSRATDALSRAQMKRELAEQSYAAALGFLSSARKDILLQGKYLAVLTPPTVGEVFILEDTLLFTMTVFFMCLLGLFIVSMLVSAVREHLRI